MTRRSRRRVSLGAHIPRSRVPCGTSALRRLRQVMKREAHPSMTGRASKELQP